MGLIAKAAAVCNSVAAIITLQKRIIGNKWSNETMRKKRIFYNPWQFGIPQKEGILLNFEPT